METPAARPGRRLAAPRTPPHPGDRGPRGRPRRLAARGSELPVKGIARLAQICARLRVVRTVLSSAVRAVADGGGPSFRGRRRLFRPAAMTAGLPAPPFTPRVPHRALCSTDDLGTAASPCLVPRRCLSPGSFCLRPGRAHWLALGYLFPFFSFYIYLPLYLNIYA